ncbi:MAG: Ig-like domain-containing protein, partial [Candidatus Paceibacterota bacterium]
STSDSESTGSQYDDSSYTLSCTGPGGTRSDTEQVDVGEEPVDPPSVSLSVSPSSVDYGDPSTLSWTASGEIDSCTATGDWSGSKSTSDSESTGSQYDDSSYTLECEGPGGSDSDTENVTVGPEPEPNSSPDADNDSYTVFENSSNNSFNVLLNDSDSDGDSLSITSITDQPDNGSASISSNRIYYTPNNGYTGNDSLRYRVSDGNGGTDTAQVSITVQAAEDYSMQLSPSDVELSENTSGTSDTVTVTIIRLNGFDGTVNLSIDSGGTSPELSGVGYSFGDSTLTGSETQSTLVVTVDDLLDPGTYTVRVRAHTSEEPGTRYRSFDINVDSPIDPEYEEF